jgi:hypothetical protein
MGQPTGNELKLENIRYSEEVMYRLPGSEAAHFGMIDKITEKGVLLWPITFDMKTGYFSGPEMEAKKVLVPHTSIYAVVVGVDRPYCQHCLKEFFSTTGNRLTCSPECQTAYNRQMLERFDISRGQSVADAVSEALASKQKTAEGRDKVLQALKSVSANAALGQDAAMAILRKYCDGLAKLSQLPPEHFDAVIAECKQAVKAVKNPKKVSKKVLAEIAKLQRGFTHDPDEVV